MQVRVWPGPGVISHTFITGLVWPESGTLGWSVARKIFLKQVGVSPGLEIITGSLIKGAVWPESVRLAGL